MFQKQTVKDVHLYTMLAGFTLLVINILIFYASELLKYFVSYRHGHEDCVRLLLSRGAQVLFTHDNESPLEIAVKV